jgi:hypothetical protein
MNDRRIIYALSAAAVLLVIVVVVLLFLILADDDGDDDAEVDSEATETATATGTEEEEDDDEEEEATPTATGTSEAGSNTPLDAVRVYIENTGQQFAGLCVDTTVEEDIGKLCATETGMSGNQIAFAVGPTFSEFTDLFFVRPEGNAYVVDHIEPAPCGGELPCPPAPGATIRILTDEGCVNARSEPSIDAPINECMDNGTQAEIISEYVEADARVWVELENFGWVSASFIQCVSNCN